jgi:membrane protease YdiL (CAAX protease family)
VLLFLGFFFLANMLLQLAIVAAASQMDFLKELLHGDFGLNELPILISFVLDVGAVVFILLLVVRLFREAPSKLGLTLENPARNILTGAGAELMAVPVIFLAGFIVAEIASLFHRVPAEQQVIQIFTALKEKGGVFFYFSVVFIVLIGPICEEIMFRGFILNALKRYVGMWGAILLASLIFASMHMDPYAWLQVFCLGVFLGYVFEKTGSLLASASLHCLHNSLMIIWAFFATSGAGP